MTAEQNGLRLTTSNYEETKVRIIYYLIQNLIINNDRLALLLSNFWLLKNRSLSNLKISPFVRLLPWFRKYFNFIVYTLRWVDYVLIWGAICSLNSPWFPPEQSPICSPTIDPLFVLLYLLLCSFMRTTLKRKQSMISCNHLRLYREKSIILMHDLLAL